VRNTVVRATIKVDGKPQILGTRSLQTPKSIDLKFDLNDYVSGLTLRAKMVQIGPTKTARERGKYNVQLVYFFFFYFSCQTLENTFLGVSPHSSHWMTCFDGD